MVWRVLLNGAMLEAVNGIDKDGRELVSTAIYRENQILTKDLPREYVKRYLDNDPTVRATVEYGTVEMVEDEEGEEIPRFTATGGPDLEESPSSSPAAQPSGSGDDGDTASLKTKVAELEATASQFDAAYGKATTRISELEGELETAKEALATAQTELEAARSESTSKLEESERDGEQAHADLTAARAEVEEIKQALEQAEEAATSGLSYNDLSVEALTIEADKKGVTPAEGSGTGSGGNIVKADLVKALTEARTAT